MNSGGLWMRCELSLSRLRQTDRQTQTEMGYMLNEKLTVPVNCVEFGGGRCLLWHDRTGVCTRVWTLLLRMNWGQWSQRARHLKEETNCWKQAPHLDFLHPRIELWPLPLFLLPLLRSRTHSPLSFPNKQAPGTLQAKTQREFGKLESPSFKEETCRSRGVFVICRFAEMFDDWWFCIGSIHSPNWLKGKWPVCSLR